MELSSPDGLWLFVTQSQSRAGLSYRVDPDGTLDAREEFYDFYVPGWADDSGAGNRDGPRWASLCGHARGSGGVRS